MNDKPKPRGRYTVHYHVWVVTTIVSLLDGSTFTRFTCAGCGRVEDTAAMGRVTGQDTMRLFD